MGAGQPNLLGMSVRWTGQTLISRKENATGELFTVAVVALLAAIVEMRKRRSADLQPHKEKLQSLRRRRVDGKT